MSILTTSIPITRTKKEAIETVEAIRAGKDGKKSKGKYLENLV